MKLKKWEIALYMALAIAILGGAGLVRSQRELSDKLIRLHVLASSDSAEDQELKLKVRDRVLSELEIMLDGVTQRDEAVRIIDENLSVITLAASGEIEKNGYSYNVSAELGAEDYPTREYDTFSLPAGRYTSLRVKIGSAAGANWWCVVFPPLCSGSDPKTALAALSEDEIALITEESAGYKVKFKLVEWVGRIFA